MEISLSTTSGEMTTMMQAKKRMAKTKSQGLNQDRDLNLEVEKNLGVLAHLAVPQDQEAEAVKGNQERDRSPGRQVQVLPPQADQGHGAETRRRGQRNLGPPHGRSVHENPDPRRLQAPRVLDPAPRLGTGQGNEEDKAECGWRERTPLRFSSYIHTYILLPRPVQPNPVSRYHQA